jgi:hypothetical protein
VIVDGQAGPKAHLHDCCLFFFLFSLSKKESEREADISFQAPEIHHKLSVSSSSFSPV